MQVISRLFTTLILLQSFVLTSTAQEPVNNNLRQRFPLVDELNTPKEAEAYPFLSADGLRLYFTSGREGGFGRLYISTRPSLQAPFTKPEALSKNLEDGFYAGTLTLDERTIYMTHEGGAIYVATRNSIDDEFSKPLPVRGLRTGYNFGPGISPDGNEMVALSWQTPDGHDKMIVYKKITVDSFAETGLLPLPAPEPGTDHYDPGPGQYSKDGLYFYFSLEADLEEHIWRYQRNRPGDKFVTIEKIILPSNTSSSKNSQPTVNQDGSVIVYITSPNNRWEEDDLAIESDPKQTILAAAAPAASAKNENGSLLIETNAGFGQAKTYPNPFLDNIVFEYPAYKGNNTFFYLYDVSGKLVFQQQITGTKSVIPLNKLVPSAYLYQVLDENKKIITSGKLVKQ